MKKLKKSLPISYYDLLTLIKAGMIPKRIKVQIPYLKHKKCYKPVYDINDFSHYELDQKFGYGDKYPIFLKDGFHEADMFIECITIENN